MLIQSSGKIVWLVFFISLIFAAVVISSDTFTQAQGKNGAEKPRAPKVEDAIERIGQGAVRAKRGFEIKQLDATTFAVRSKNVEIGKLKCASCPGGKCSGVTINGGATCRGCGGDVCTISPF